MKLAVISANSNVGKQIVEEALKRGMDVTVFVRLENETKATNVVKKEVMDITAEDLAPFDAVIDASAVWTEDYVARHYKTVMHLCDCLAGTDKQFLIVGGEGLFMNEKEVSKWFEDVQIHEHRDKDKAITTKWFGSFFDAAASSIAQYAGQFSEFIDEDFITLDTLFADLKRRNDVNWLFMDPSCEIANSIIEVAMPYSDYAKDMLDELEHGIHYRQRVGTTCQ